MNPPVCLRCGHTAIREPKTDKMICPGCRNVVRAIWISVKISKNPK